MARSYFGTDGIRGRANAEPMTPEIAMQVGLAAGHYFKTGDHRHRVVIGKDTRLSGYMIEPALTAGFASMGMDVLLFGPLPTPAVAQLTRSMRADLGVMISASHNPYHDNGIKLFGPDGFKLPDEVEEKLEALIDAGLPDEIRADGADLGRVKRLDDAMGRYMEHAKATLQRGMRLDGLKIVIDCANGAAYKVAPTVLWELGAEVISIGVSPNGLNINDGCGSTATDLMCKTVVETGADIGIALDGDADRVLISDENGKLVDGDQLMALIAGSWAEAGLLKGGLVATIMSNLGLERYLQARNIDMLRTQVGDRYVVEAMRERGWNVGGEQSGHLVLSDYATTGDGLVAALQVLTAVVGTRMANPSARVSEICHLFDPYPQILKNVRFETPVDLNDAAIVDAVKAAETAFGDGGRVVLRKSGTEPLVRVMAEGEDQALVEKAVDDIAAAVAQVGGVAA